MGARRRSRETAMQALFYMDIRNDIGQEMFDRYCQNFPPSKKIEPFFGQIVEGVMAAVVKIDAVIESYSSNWKLSRISGVDRNIMRVAVYELLYCSDIPTKVSINEAVDVAKKYGTEESGAFINGVLDSIHLAKKKGDKRLLKIAGTISAK
jgi:transcription antitermination protein NusB